MQQGATYSHWLQDQVRWADTDMIGHANNLSFAGFCESGRAHMLKKFMHQDASPRVLLVLAEMRLRYIAEAKWPAIIDIGTGVSTIGKRSCWTVQGLFDGDRCVCVAESALVVVDEATHRPREMPEILRELLLRHRLEAAAPMIAEGVPA